MNSSRLVPWLCLLLLLACGKKGAPSEPAPVSGDGGTGVVAQLVTRRGAVRVQRGGALVAAEPGVLARGEALETGDDGDALVRFSNGRQVEVGPQARVILEEDATGGVAAVSRGGAVSREAPEGAGKQALGSLTLLTPFGLARLGSNADQAKVDVDAEAGHVEVLQGSVEVVPQKGKPVKATRGQVVSVTGSGVTVGSVTAQASPLKVLSAMGQVDWRVNDSERWRSVEGEEEALKDGGSVRVGRGMLLLRLGGGDSTLELGSGGEMMVVGAARRGAQDEARLDLVQGEMRLMLVPGRSSRVVLPGLFVESPQGARLDVRRIADGYVLTARAGDLMLVRGAVRESLEAGQRATVVGSSPASLEYLERAALALHPEDGQQVFHQHLDEVALTWADEGEVRVEVAQDAAFQERVLAGVARRGFVNVEAPARGELHWRVRKLEGNGQLAQGSASFEPERTRAPRSRTAAPALAITAPREGQRAGAKVRVTGTAPQDATLRVNGQPVTLDARHRFDTSVAAPRPPVVVFQMSRPNVPDAYTVRVLK